MKSKLKIHRIPLHSDAWYNFRTTGIGGSDMGGILGWNKNESLAKIFYEKIGEHSIVREGTTYMFWGREMEDKIAEIWKYWDGSEFGYINNREVGKIIRKCKNTDGYITNPDYPWLFASLDRLINKDGGVNMISGEMLTEEGILECKNQGFWAKQVWESGMPDYFIAQIHTYMIILEVDYAEIAILTNGNEFRVEYIKRDETTCEGK